MNNLFLLKLIAELLSSDKPTPDEIGVAKKILREMIEESEPAIPPKYNKILEELSNLDPVAEQARKELLS